jgi:transcriptional regulator with PAS, ATPase and Fis domain
MSKRIETGEFPDDRQLPRESFADGLVFTSSNPRMSALLDAARRAAVGDTTILLTGESGTGKDVLARRIHRWSPRRHRPFIVINCTNLAEQLFENELFAHVRGAFTGASNDRPGRLEAAEGGTVLFDEIAELPTSLQAKFLRFVEERSFERIGGGQTISVDVRLIVASSRDLEAEVAAGRFRQDLFYRINVITFALPPLRERTEDIPSLARAVLSEHSKRLNRLEPSLSSEAAKALVSHRWPGNLRELHNTLERAATLTNSVMITPGDLPDSVRYPAHATNSSVHETNLKDLERAHILHVLAESPTLGRAAATLGIAVTTLWRKRKQYGID